MKKVLAVGLLAICAIALSQQHASAWINNRFGVGMNWSYQSGGNSVCGIWRNGQPPGPETMYSAPSHAPYYGAPNFYGHAQGFYSGFDSAVAPGGNMPMPQAIQPYAQPYQFATYPRPVYYSPYPYYGR
jgi:hypothetical protein